MKTIIFVFTLVIAGAMISGYKQSAQNKKAEKFANQIATKYDKDVNKPDIRASKGDQESLTTKKVPEGKPRILFILHNDTGQTEWSPSLWWSYQHATIEQPGC